MGDFLPTFEIQYFRKKRYFFRSDFTFHSRREKCRIFLGRSVDGDKTELSSKRAGAIFPRSALSRGRVKVEEEEEDRRG